MSESKDVSVVKLNTLKARYTAKGILFDTEFGDDYNKYFKKYLGLCVEFERSSRVVTQRHEVLDEDEIWKQLNSIDALEIQLNNIFRSFLDS